jgi:adenylate kinase family enzyme
VKPGAQRIVIFGNSGSGKSTMAAAMSREHGVPHLDLDSLAWSTPGIRKPLLESRREIEAFVAAHSGWIAEGCYADLLEILIPHAAEIRFLNPGTDTCVANCLRRPWEPGKYPSKEAQDAMLEFLIEWVREYETRYDEYSLARHRELFDRFQGPKREITALPEAG